MQLNIDGRVWRSIRSLLLPLALVSSVACSPYLAAGQQNSDKLSPGEHYENLEDVRLHYSVAGRGPLLMVCSPGWGIGSKYLELGLAPLEEHFKLLFIDTRGSGKSSRPLDQSRMSGADMADDIERLRVALGLKEIMLLGHSDSGSIALDYAERYPNSIAKLIFVDGITYGSETVGKMDDAERERLIHSASSDIHYKAAAEAMSRAPVMTDEGMAEYLQQILPIYFANVDKLPALAKTTEGTRPSSWAWQFHEKANRSHSWHQDDQLRRVLAKTLIIVGKQDRVCPTLIAERVHSGINGSRLIEIDGSGHFPWIEQPSRFFDSVVQFLQ